VRLIGLASRLDGASGTKGIADGGGNPAAAWTLPIAMFLTVRSDAIDLKYEDDFGVPVLLTVTADFVAAHEMTSGSVNASDLQTFIIEDAIELKAKASECRPQGLASQVLR
jgi:hypothetical protein